jgi:hypothetical protein
VGQEGEWEPIVAADADEAEAELGDGDDLLGGLGAQVGQLAAFQIGPQALDRVELGGVRRQELQLQPLVLGSALEGEQQPGPRPVRAVGQQPSHGDLLATPIAVAQDRGLAARCPGAAHRWVRLMPASSAKTSRRPCSWAFA